MRGGELERLNGKFKEETWTVVDCKCNTNDGYCHVRFKSSMILYHAIMWILINGTIEDVNTELDHANGNRLDNRIENLRLVTNRENQQNSHKHRNGRLQGCSLDKRRNKWQARIQINGKQISLGHYDTEPEAHTIYYEALTMLDKSVEEIQAHFGVAQFSSGYKSVSFHKQSGKWEARIKINGRLIYLGLYNSEPEAHQIYLKALELINEYVDNKQFRQLLSKSTSLPSPLIY